jgi:hypothetical protein
MALLPLGARAFASPSRSRPEGLRTICKCTPAARNALIAEMYGSGRLVGTDLWPWSCRLNGGVMVCHATVRNGLQRLASLFAERVTFRQTTLASPRFSTKSLRASGDPARKNFSDLSLQPASNPSVHAMFYLDLMVGQEAIWVDEEGYDLPDSAAALEEARASARDLMSADVQNGRSLGLNRWFRMRDDSGLEVGCLLFRGLLPDEN